MSNHKNYLRVVQSINVVSTMPRRRMSLITFTNAGFQAIYS